MEKKDWYKSKEIWLAIGVVFNSVLNGFGLPAIPLTPEFVGAIAVIFFALRGWFTDAAIAWTKS